MSTKPKEPAAIWMRTSALVPWIDNPKQHGEDQIAVLCESIRETAKDAAAERGDGEVQLRDGFGAPLVVRFKDSEIVAGHGRVLAAERLGIEWLPVRPMDISAKQAHRLARADNRIAELSPWDDSKLAEQLIADAADGADALLAQGFDESRLDIGADDSGRVLGEPKVKRVETAALKAEFWLTVRGPIPAQPDVIEQLVDSLGKLEGVEVDVGMVKDQ